MKVKTGQIWETDENHPNGKVRFTIIGEPVTNSSKTHTRVQSKHLSPDVNMPVVEKDLSLKFLTKWTKLVSL